jgi:hypothetical protein
MESPSEERATIVILQEVFFREFCLHCALETGAVQEHCLNFFRQEPRTMPALLDRQEKQNKSDHKDGNSNGNMLKRTPLTELVHIATVTYI